MSKVIYPKITVLSSRA